MSFFSGIQSGSGAGCYYLDPDLEELSPSSIKALAFAGRSGSPVTECVPLIFRAKLVEGLVSKSAAEEKEEKKEAEPERDLVTLSMSVTPSGEVSISISLEESRRTIANLMGEYTLCWSEEKKDFILPSNSFRLGSFTKLLKSQAEKFKKVGVDGEEHFGFIQKFDLDPSTNPRIYMRADLHGDLKSLIENLRTLQEQNLLDANFNCQPGVHLVFLGDYCDRGEYGTEILEMLMLLREENLEQVHLIRGNHEYMETNACYGANDMYLMQVLGSRESSEALKGFYETMALTFYFSQEVEEGEAREYIQCTHGLFEVSTDPAPLLDQGDSGDYLPIPRARELGNRVVELSRGESELSKSACRIAEIFREGRWLNAIRTTYNWGDVNFFRSKLGRIEGRDYWLGPSDIHHYLQLSSVDHKVKMLFRGHQHDFEQLTYDRELLVTTLTIGMDSPLYRGDSQLDRAYIMTLGPKIAGWTKQAILRKSGEVVTGSVEEPVSLNTMFQ